MISRRSPPRIATHQIQPAMAAVATPDTAIATTAERAAARWARHEPARMPAISARQGMRVGRVHERDHADHGRARVGAQQHAPQRGQEQDHDRRSQHEERERRRLVDLHDQPVDQRAQVPGGRRRRRGSRPAASRSAAGSSRRCRGSPPGRRAAPAGRTPSRRRRRRPGRRPPRPRAAAGRRSRRAARRPRTTRSTSARARRRARSCASARRGTARRRPRRWTAAR